jgi:hypothetical protein
MSHDEGRPNDSDDELSRSFSVNVNPQVSSARCNTLPAELRREIFALSLSSFSDSQRPYPFDSYWYRPGYTAPKKTDLALLMTCKPVYNESGDLIWREGSGNEEEAFWWGDMDRRPPEYRMSLCGPNYASIWDESDDELAGEANFEVDPDDYDDIAEISAFEVEDSAEIFDAEVLPQPAGCLVPQWVNVSVARDNNPLWLRVC